MHRIWRVLRELDCESRIIQNTLPLEDIDADALVLSGGAARIAWESLKLGNCTDYLAKFKGPILGVCVGHQLMGVYYGGKAGPCEIPEFGLAKIKIIEENELFRGLPKEFQVWQSHNDEVKEVKDDIVLAESANCRIQAMKHKSKPHYGVQFHPEVNDTEHGEEIYKNFIEVVSKHCRTNHSN